MASFGDATMPSTRRTRKSIGATDSRKNGDKENATIDVGSTLAESRKKSRSKSIGPGGLDALKNANGNRRAVSLPCNGFYAPLANMNSPLQCLHGLRPDLS